MIAKKSLALYAALAGAFAAGPATGAFMLPTGQYVTYGDARSYSLAISGELIGCTGPGCPYYVNSTPGAIKDLTVMGTGSDGQPVTTNYDGANNAFATPNGETYTPKGKQTSDQFFVTGGLSYPFPAPTGTIDYPASDPGGNFTYGANNLGGAWDVELGALKGFLNSQDMIIFFNNNNINSGAATNQNLAAWAVLWVTKGGSSGNLEIIDDPFNAGQKAIYFFTNAAPGGGAGLYAPVPIGGGIPANLAPDAAGSYYGVPTFGSNPLNALPKGYQGYLQACLTTSAAPPIGTYQVAYQAPGTCPAGTTNLGIYERTDYVLSGGEVCIGRVGGVPVRLEACDSARDQIRINNNLGANQAVYALEFPELNKTLANLFGSGGNLDDYALHVRVMLGCDPREYGLDDGTGGAAAPSTGTTEAAKYGQKCLAKSLNNGYEQFFISTAERVIQTPEPQSLALISIALLGVGFAAKRRLTN